MHLQKSGQNYHNILNSHDFDDLPPLDNSDDDIFDDEELENLQHSDDEITADNFDELVFGNSGSDDTDSSDTSDSDTSDTSD